MGKIGVVGDGPPPVKPKENKYIPMRMFERNGPTEISVGFFIDKLPYPIGIAQCSTLCKADSMYFNRLYIRPEYRGKGLGSKLLDRLLELVKDRNIELQLDINPYGEMDYLELECFYVRHGFKKYKVNDVNILGLGDFYTYFYNKKEE